MKTALHSSNGPEHTDTVWSGMARLRETRLCLCFPTHASHAVEEFLLMLTEKKNKQV